MIKLIRRWPLRTILRFGMRDYIVCGYMAHGQFVRLGVLRSVDPPQISERINRSVKWVEDMISITESFTSKET